MKSPTRGKERAAYLHTWETTVYIARSHCGKSIVFGDEHAFFKLCKALPDILDDVIADLQCGSIHSTVCDELRELSPDTFKSLYLLAFSTYDGFQNF